MDFSLLEEPDFFEPGVSTVAICDYETFYGDTLREKFEGIYVKLLELKNILIAKATKAKLDVGEIVINSGEFIADLFETSRTYCFGEPPDRTVEKPLIGDFTIGDTSHKVYWDKGLSRNKVVVECKAGKGLLIIQNIPNLEENGISA
jgi:hypothetical protein